VVDLVHSKLYKQRASTCSYP